MLSDTHRDLLIAMLLVSNFIAACWMAVTNGRLSLLEAQHEEVVLENRFLARKIQETHEAWQNGDKRRDLQLKFAVNGFRTGSWRAYQSVVAEARRQGLEVEVEEYVQR